MSAAVVAGGTFAVIVECDCQRAISLSAAVRGLPEAELRGEARILDISTDSRRVGPGALFCAVPGTRRDGHGFAAEAVAAGAGALLVERFVDLPVPQVRVPAVRPAVGPVAAEVHGRPADELAVAAVTGTNGKTTTVHLVEAALAAGGVRTGLSSTVEARWPGWRSPAELTTPGAADLQRMLCRMRSAGVRAAVVEVSSHAIDQHRIDPVRAEVAVFTNLSPEHLDYHGTVEQYFATKAALFTPRRCRRAVINVDDCWGRRLAAQVEVPTVTVGRSSRADVRVEEVGPRVVFHEGGDPVSLTAPAVIGGRHAAGLAAAYAAARAMGVSKSAAVRGLTAALPPGRFQRVDVGQPFLAVVDFAHTPTAVADLIAAARRTSGGRVHLVVGCAGNRDRFSRPDVGRAALAADTAIFTTDDPCEEDPAEITAQVLTGTIGVSGGEFVVEHDRRAAIAAAVGRAGPGDVVLVAGRGHERYQAVDGGRRPFDDVEVVTAALADAGWAGPDRGRTCG
ncbi:UDP-N-acetylmuramoyl-L-alanyl-D-glutamate--2,6-diaminopimelate ligase [Saccharopolyspora sp. WRP15-2]|uniref:UDP-N-acetylmuramyl-tripeptide synthetase n=1 Tax=Saccharopolyspora oryzae TaxID=2997343 RepID=A0ABT4V977_9PSEU|nr:UDP-N-acetylmuramoyl-L-alanyl-D-glutamate--2,6-diaminopimelate ligase [Saccharopolyspora oryzae]MDA3630508.1 UDP-N-acetylmuramoyl-L-alanyl-D-glutamate--2,6-diaminopimelate ligase [Saccharopolyspora oryzae]